MKKCLSVIPLVLLLCFVVGCQDKAAMAELEGFKAQAALEEQNKEIVRNAFKMLDEGNLEDLLELMAPDCLWYAPSNSPAPMNKEESGELAATILNTFSGYSEEIEEIMAAGDKVIARVNSVGTHTGEYLGIPATGKTVEYSSINIFSLKDGKIVEIREDYDSLGLMQQLGMELKPKEAKK